jgi:hypothetical protein
MMSSSHNVIMFGHYQVIAASSHNVIMSTGHSTSNNDTTTRSVLTGWIECAWQPEPVEEAGYLHFTSAKTNVILSHF